MNNGGVSLWAVNQTISVLVLACSVVRVEARRESLAGRATVREKYLILHSLAFTIATFFCYSATEWIERRRNNRTADVFI